MKPLALRGVTVAIAMVLLAFQVALAQWVAVARSVKRMRTNDLDVATVMLEAKPERVYQTVIGAATGDTKLKIINRDDAVRLVEFTNGSRNVAIQVDAVAEGLTQLTIGATSPKPRQQSTTDLVLEQVLKVCQQMGVSCSVAGH